MTAPGKSLVVAGSRAVGRGRPSQYTQELAELICERIAEGEVLSEICADPDMPKASAVRGWDYDDRDGRTVVAAGFAKMYARAVEIRTEHELDRLRTISQRPILGQVVTEKEVLDKEGRIVVLREVRSGDNVAARALEIDALKWRIAKMQPHKYNRKAEGDASPGDADAAAPAPRLIIEGGLPDDDDPPPPPATPPVEET